MTLTLALLLAYSASLVAIGAWIGRSVRSSADFFVSGRSLGPAALFATFMAANIGAASTVNATGLGYHHGLAAWWWNGSAGIGTLILAFWIGPRIWRLASERGYLTTGDFLEDHFGKPVRLFAGAAIWIGTIFLLVAQIIGAAAVLQRAGNLSELPAALLSVIAMTAYFVVGGLKSSAWVNRVQLFVILFGFSLAAFITTRAVGGVSTVLTAVPDTSFFMGTSGSTGWPLLFLVGPAFFLSPGLVQRAFAARSVEALQRGVAVSGVALLVFAFLPVALGMAARVMMPELVAVDYKLVLPSLLVDGVPGVIGSIALAAVFSAEISSADAVLYMLATSGARDLYKGVIHPDATDAQLVRAARLLAVLGGALGFAMVFFYSDKLFTVLEAFYGILGVTLLAPILGGLFLPKGGERAALSAMIVGVVVFGLASYMDTAKLVPGAPAWITPSLLGLVASSAAYLVVAATRTRRPSAR
jgi:solute:Na+ symporter, SSS family